MDASILAKDKAEMLTRLRDKTLVIQHPERDRIADEIERLLALLKEIQAYSVGDPLPRHTWYYDRIEKALNQQSVAVPK